MKGFSFGTLARRAIGVLSIVVAVVIAFGMLHAPATKTLDPAADRATVLAENLVRIAISPEGQAPARWDIPVRIVVGGSKPDDVGPLIVNAARTFGRVSGVPATVVSRPEDGFNVLVQVLSRADYTALVGRMGRDMEGGKYLEEHLVCYSAVISRPGGRVLLRATIAIPDDLSPADREQCAWHEMLHAFGLIDHPDDRVPSVLRDAPAPTDDDAVLLRAFYDPRIQALADGDDPLPTVRAVIAELLTTPGPGTLATTPP